MTDAPLILWFRRDLRLTDQPMLAAAAETGRPVIPVAILDDLAEGLGAAPKWRWGEALAAFSGRLEEIGSRMVFRRGPAREVLEALVRETGAEGVWWSRLYDPEAKARDAEIKSALKGNGVEARSFPGLLLFEPWTVETGQGGPYRVYTPYWKAVRDRDVGGMIPETKALPAPAEWPDGDALADWALGAAMRRGAAIVAKHSVVGEAGALKRLDGFLQERIGGYREHRNSPAARVTSGLSENLAQGEIGPRQIWHAARHAMQEGAAGAETFLKELVWREFAYHLLHHFPEMLSRNWKQEWDKFPWRGDGEAAERWRRGMTGEPLVDAGLREMYVTGTMHNRVRMVVASYLTKHLLTDWRVGQRWFEECLIDWDPASNAMGWQWVAGSGPDAAPYFRVFNPETQAEKFDPEGAYRQKFLAEPSRRPCETALDYFHAVPRSWKLDPKANYPDRMIGLQAGRERALAAYQQREG